MSEQTPREADPVEVGGPPPALGSPPADGVPPVGRPPGAQARLAQTIEPSGRR